MKVTFFDLDAEQEIQVELAVEIEQVPLPGEFVFVRGAYWKVEHRVLMVEDAGGRVYVRLVVSKLKPRAA